MSIESSGTSQNKNRHEREAELGSLWDRFTQKYETDEDCWNEIYRNAIEYGDLSCSRCGSREFAGFQGERVIRCSRCNKLTWFTSGTFFEKIREPKAWLGAIWLMENGAVVSSLKFHQMAKISQSSALNILRKIRIVIFEQKTADPDFQSTSFFSDAIFKRSLETERREHPRDEEKPFASSAESDCCGSSDEGHGENAEGPRGSDESNEGASPAPVGDLSENEAAVFDVLTLTPISFDDLCARIDMEPSKISAALTFLKILGLARSEPGDRHMRCGSVPDVESGRQVLSSTNPGCAKKAIDTIVRFVESGFRGVSRKYLGLYVAAFRCAESKIYQARGKLLSTCFCSPPINYRQILEFVTPALIDISLV